MSIIMDFLKTNYVWIFSGIGVFFISLFFINRGGKKVKNEIKNGSGNIQSGGNVIIHQTNKEKDEQTIK